MPKNDLEMRLVVKDDGTVVIKKFSKTTEQQLSNIDNKSQKTTSNMIAGWKKLIGVLGVAGVGLALKNVITQTLDLGDKLNKMNLRLGVSVAELDKLRKVAQLGGVQFKTVSTSLTVMARNLDMAARGTGEAADALEGMGINVDTLLAQKPKEQFLQIAEAIMKIENPSTRAAKAQQLLGRSGAELLSIFPNLREALAGTNSEWDNEKAQRVANFNDKITKLTEKFKDVAVNIVDKLLPAFNLFIDNLSTITNALGGLLLIKIAPWLFELAAAARAAAASFILLGGSSGIGLLIRDFKILSSVTLGSGLINWLKMFGEALKTSGIMATILNPAMWAVVAVLGAFYATYKINKYVVEKAAKEVDDFKKSIKDMSAEVLKFEQTKLEVKIRKIQDSINKFQKNITTNKPSGRGALGLGDEASNVVELTNELEQLNKKLEVVNGKINDFATAKNSAFGDSDAAQRWKRNRRFTSMMDNLAPPIETIDSDIKQLPGFPIDKIGDDEAARIIKEQEDQYTHVMVLTDMWATFYDDQTKLASEASIKKQKVLDDLEKIEADKIAASLKKLQASGEAFARFLGDRFTDSFMSFLDGTKNAAEAFKEFAVSVLRDLSKILIKMAIMNAMKAAFGGASGGYGGMLSSLGTIFGMAKGGDVQGGQTVLVGEKGPELFTAPSSGSIIPNDALGGGGMSIVVNVNRPVGSDEQARETGRLIAREVNATIDKRLAYQRKPGGILRTSGAMGY